MPNDCWNTYTAIGHPSEIQQLYTNELEPLLTTNGGDGLPVIKIYKMTNNGIRFHFWSRNFPNKEWMEQMLEQYSSLWIKNTWCEEGGYAGVIVGGKLYGIRQPLQDITWNDVPIEDEFHEMRN